MLLQVVADKVAQRPAAREPQAIRDSIKFSGNLSRKPHLDADGIHVITSAFIVHHSVYNVNPHLMSSVVKILDILLRAARGSPASGAQRPVRRRSGIRGLCWYRRAPPPPPPLGHPPPLCPCAPAGGALLACSVLRSWGRGLVAPPPALRGGRWSRALPQAPAATARRVGGCTYEPACGGSNEDAQCTEAEAYVQRARLRYLNRTCKGSTAAAPLRCRA